MKAVVVTRDDPTPQVIEIGKPSVSSGEVLVRVLRVGIDGTDHEVIAGNHGGFPAQSEHMVLGHEAVGVVEDGGDTDLTSGQMVVPTVRRPPASGSNEYFKQGQPDMAPAGLYVERGIDGAHGHMAEFVTAPSEFLVPVPDSFREFGFLVEPLSNAVKAIEHAEASRSAFRWAPETAIVLGNGPLGLLALAFLRHKGYSRLYCLGRRDRPDQSIDIIERFGATYVDSRETSLSDLATIHEPMDLVVEATGYARHGVESVRALAPNGVAALLGIPSASTFKLDGGTLHREMVLKNQALVGSVNSHVGHFETAREALTDTPSWFVDQLVTGVFPPHEIEAAFESDRQNIKAVINFEM
ncbi:glucose 1-dehydrogenase [Halogranum amylolyticum]|uniref:Glucose 1-dehydrogenase n=1 Tax=Halogranum amylolyticum TaxID=660520 RepID=A0A1H8UIQ9_9EURY|nr:glucose 1-dehydrogenase [Halogranum amylolyticum]SEP03110.1 glucose 1-dehydrogenase [Halogranum amylolyticum]